MEERIIRSDIGSLILLALTLAACVVIVIVVVRLENLLSQLLFTLVDVCVKLVAILTNRELLVIINWDVYPLCTYWLIIWIVELGNIGVSESLLSSKSLAGVELHQVLQ